LPDNIKDVPDDIVGKVIECQHQGKCNEQCTEAFRIIEPELAFYRRMNLPLPRLCPTADTTNGSNNATPQTLEAPMPVPRPVWPGSDPSQNLSEHLPARARR